ncbi:MAG: hypothetical protein HN712_04235 [Gemmatimonadetes bacterium]|jgi:hypothetical protein|nr:hypothetical protein [Gemmatimonadota bacterium]MBT6145194.1 hypothetical protein [Gemmatimonadota bacterium]MBT7859492.1 hypothetical protein [Gemmatimonadota bacterium]
MTVTQEGLTFGDGGVRLTCPWAVGVGGEILVDGERVQGEWTPDATDSWVCRVGGWQLVMQQPAPGLLALRLVNVSAERISLGTVHLARWRPDVFNPRLPTAEFRELIHGGSFVNIASGVKCVGRKTSGLDAAVPSSVLTVFQHDDGTALLLGVLPPVGEAFSELVTLHDEPHLEGDFGVEVRHQFDCEVEPGAAVCTSALVALSGAPGTDLMAQYGDLWHQRLERKPSRPPMTGWNSWDYYAGAVTREIMDENLQAGRQVLGEGRHVLAIDEGWEQQWGTWEPNAKFAAGLEDYCQHVTSAGWCPGIWTAPLLVNTYNPLYLEKPEWFAARADGQIQVDAYSYGPMAYLDVTRPEVLDHIEGIFRRLRGMGFEYFKVDFSHCILGARMFHDRRVGRADLIRRAFEAIRRAIGAEAYLLSCGSPYESVVGLVDAVRSTGDIHIFWGHVLRNVGALATRWWMQGNLWNCDPDFLVVRGPDTALPPYAKRAVVSPLGLDNGWLAGREFSATEARTYALLVHLTGGDLFLSDPLQRMGPEGLQILGPVITPRAVAAVPVDLFDSEQDLPRIWISRTAEDTLVGLFNWGDKPARMDFDPSAYGLRGDAVDFWSGDAIQALPTRMPRRSSVALRFDGE